MIHTCLREVLMIYFVGVLQARRSTTLHDIVIVPRMEDTTVAREWMQKIYKVGFGDLPYLMSVSYMCLHVWSEIRWVTSQNETRCP